MFHNCPFICVFVFASNPGHFRINDFFAVFGSVIFVEFNLFLFLQKKWGIGV